MTDNKNEDETVTYMIMQFGQFLDHDIVSTPDRPDLTDCCNNRNTPDCFPIIIPKDDQQFRPLGIDCMEFARSLRACGNGVRQQISQISAFIDGSQIYGSSDKENANIRTFEKGLLQTSNNGLNLPLNPNSSGCATHGTDTEFCFRAGDNRVNVQPGLIAIQTLFLREHNRIARIIHSMLPRFTDEMIFQETRKIVIAQLENIVYNEYLPIILGPYIMNRFDLNLPRDGHPTSYDSNIDPSIINSFAAAAYRFGHSQIHNFGKVGIFGSKFALKDNFNNPTVIHRAGVDSVLIGCVNQKAEGMDNFMVEAVSKFLLKKGNNSFGFDLAAFNIQRGRDHGIPSYNEFRQFCKLSRIRSFNDLSSVFSHRRVAGMFRELYDHVNDIDFFPAGIAENPVRGGLVGPTFACIIGIQFHRLLYGDRYFFTHKNQAGSLDYDERAELRKRTLASIMCDNLRISSIQLNAFLPPSARNRIVPCYNHPKIDFNV